MKIKLTASRSGNIIEVETDDIIEIIACQGETTRIKAEHESIYTYEHVYTFWVKESIQEIFELIRRADE